MEEEDFRREYVLTPETRAALDRAAEKRKHGTKPAKKKATGTKFVMLPWWWVAQLSKSNSAVTYQTAVTLLYLRWRRKSRTFALTNGDLDAGDGVSRWGKRRALAELETLGLIRVERHPRKSPIVTVILEGKT